MQVGTCDTDSQHWGHWSHVCSTAATLHDVADHGICSLQQGEFVWKHAHATYCTMLFASSLPLIHLTVGLKLQPTIYFLQRQPALQRRLHDFATCAKGPDWFIPHVLMLPVMCAGLYCTILCVVADAASVGIT